MILILTFTVTDSSLKYFFTISHVCNRQNSQTPHPQLNSTQQVRRHVWSEQETSYLTILLRSHWSVQPETGSHWTRILPRPVYCLKVYLRMMFAHNSESHIHWPCPVTLSQTPLPCSCHHQSCNHEQHTWVDTGDTPSNRTQESFLLVIVLSKA